MASEIRVNSLTNRSGLSTVSITDTGAVIAGLITATTFSGPLTGAVTGNVTGNIVGNVTGNIVGNVTGNTSGTAGGLTGSPSITVADITATGNVSIGGTLTYEDVTNIDSVGIITAQSDVHVGAGLSVVGIITAQSDVLVGRNLSVASGISTVKALDYTAIDTTISDTAVDVFIYDTSKDSDGGAWRKRTQNTSWYNETLGTATRGTRKEFPAVAVIVAETTKVTIYDGDDPDLPMWMEFDAGEQTANGKMLQFWGTATTGVVSSVTMLNGVMVVGTNNGSSGGIYVGMTAVNFASDSAYYRRNSSDQYIIIGNSISDRNVNQYGGFAKAGGLGGGNANDVAMTVLPNASIDDATGLPIPTIAVATESGVSVIKDDGTVADITQNSPYKVANNVFFSDYGKLLYDTEDTSVVYEVDIPSSDIGYGAYNSTSNGRVIYPTGTHAGFSSGEIRLLGRNMGDGGKLITKGAFAFDANGASETINGLTLFDREESNPAFNSLLAFVASDYNTGWMHGNIKGAFLSDTDTTNVTGSNLIDNGDFGTGNFTNWSTSGTTAPSISSGGALLTTGAADGAIWQSTSGEATSGKWVITWTITSNSGGFFGLFLNNNGANGSGGSLVKDSITTSGSYYYEGSITAVEFRHRGSSSGIIDNITLRRVEDDRSVNNKGLAVFGTVTKSAVATGAELVAYSGFSASNYLQQPYNSDLDFGNGDFSVAYWFNQTTHSNFQDAVNRVDAGQNNGSWLIQHINDGSIQLYMRTSGSYTTYLNSGSILLTDRGWTQIVVVRRNGYYVMYLDGEQIATGAGTTSLTVNNAQLQISGRLATSTYPILAGNSIALLRVSSTVPSPEQIKKIYEDERELFQPNAKATLYDSSDVITALAFDDDTNLLHVGTSSGRSDFQGLRRINNNTTAVTTAITAQNEFIIEQ